MKDIGRPRMRRGGLESGPYYQRFTVRKLVEVRLAFGEGREAFARRLKDAISGRSLYEVEKGKKTLTVAALERVLQALDLDVRDFFEPLGIVHYLDQGKTPCNMRTPARLWPEGHRWTRYLRDTNCPRCRAATDNATRKPRKRAVSKPK